MIERRAWASAGPGRHGTRSHGWCQTAPNFEETIMLRKLSLVAVAAASLGAAALAPTAASAWGGGWHHGGWHHGGYHGWGGPRVFIGGPAYYGGGYGGCYARRLVPTPWGPRWRLVNRCY